MKQVTVLGIPVTEEMLDVWEGFYAAPRQPFRLAGLDPTVRTALPTTPEAHLTPELRDTFFVYGSGPWVWFSEAEFARLAPTVRAGLVAERRRRTRPKPPVAWPSDPHLRVRLVRWVEAGVRPSLHSLAGQQLAQVTRRCLPRAAELAGAFPTGSGANCFGTVMAATGLQTHGDWVQQDQFDRWLQERTIPVGGGSDLDPGRVLVWHERGRLAHAAVTIGGGFVLNKPSQSWSSPTLVWTVEELVNSWRLPGTRLSRREIRTT